MTASRQRRLGRLALLLLVLLCYGSAWRAPFVFDDVPNLLENDALAKGRWSALLSGGTGDAGDTLSGRPVSALSFWFNRLLSGSEPGGYRMANVFLHSVGALLLFGLVRRLAARARHPGVRDHAIEVGWGVAALWALHPLQTSAVTYIIQRVEILSALGVLACVYAFVRGLEATEPRRWWILSILAAWVGIGAKETAVVAPLAVLLVDRANNAEGWGALLRHRAGLYGGLAAGWLLLAALGILSGGRGGTAGFDSGVSPLQYLLTQAEAIVRYVRLIVWPHPLVFDYGTSLVSGFGAVWWQFTVVGLTVCLVFFGLWRGRLAALVAAWFFLLLAPSSSIVPVASQTVAEHRLYLALAAPIFAAIVLAWRFLGRRSWWIVLPVLGLLGAVTVARNADYRSARSLWADTVAKRPDNTRARINLALALLADGQSSQALAQLGRAVQLDPRSADAQFNLGVVNARQGRMEEAAAAYAQAVDLRPGFAAAHLEFSILNLELGAVALALKHARQAAQYAPNSAAAAYQLGNALLAAGLSAEARLSFERTVTLAPSHADALVNLGNLMAEAGGFDQAIAHYEHALQADSTLLAAHRNAGAIHAHLGRWEKAIMHYEAAVRLAPSDARLRAELQELRAARRR